MPHHIAACTPRGGFREEEDMAPREEEDMAPREEEDMAPREEGGLHMACAPPVAPLPSLASTSRAFIHVANKERET